MKLQHRLLCLVALACFAANTLGAQSVSSASIRPPPPFTNTVLDADAIILPEPLRDPIEPFNRAVWSFNEGLMTSVIKPAARGYRFVVPKPARQGIGNAGRNLTFPVRFINELLQGNWRAMGDETARCLLQYDLLALAAFSMSPHARIYPKETLLLGRPSKSGAVSLVYF